MSEIPEEVYEVVRALTKSGTLSYAYDQWQITRMRLFSEVERARLLHALDQASAPNTAGLMDELEMVRFETHGKTAEQLKHIR